MQHKHNASQTITPSSQVSPTSQHPHLFYHSLFFLLEVYSKDMVFQEIMMPSIRCQDKSDNLSPCHWSKEIV